MRVNERTAQKKNLSNAIREHSPHWQGDNPSPLAAEPKGQPKGWKKQWTAHVAASVKGAASTTAGATESFFIRTAASVQTKCLPPVADWLRR